jgi:hypothetical protein
MKWPRFSVPPICPSAFIESAIWDRARRSSVPRGSHVRGGQTIPVQGCAELSWASIPGPVGPGNGADLFVLLQSFV